jgi:hypothetical protein
MAAIRADMLNEPVDDVAAPAAPPPPVFDGFEKLVLTEISFALP